MFHLQAEFSTLCNYEKFAETVAAFHRCMPAVIDGAAC